MRCHPSVEPIDIISPTLDRMGAFIFAQAALREMNKHKRGTLIFTGATASLKGSAGFAAFAPAKFVTLCTQSRLLTLLIHQIRD